MKPEHKKEKFKRKGKGLSSLFEEPKEKKPGLSDNERWLKIFEEHDQYFNSMPLLRSEQVYNVALKALGFSAIATSITTAIPVTVGAIAGGVAIIGGGYMLHGAYLFFSEFRR